MAAISKQMDDNIDIAIDKRLGVLQDQSVLWLWKAHQTLNKPEIIKKVNYSCLILYRNLTIYYQAFEMCHAGEFNMLYENFTIYETRQKLHDLKKN